MIRAVGRPDRHERLLSMVHLRSHERSQPLASSTCGRVASCVTPSADQQHTRPRGRVCAVTDNAALHLMARRYFRHITVRRGLLLVAAVVLATVSLAAFNLAVTEWRLSRVEPPGRFYVVDGTRMY